MQSDAAGTELTIGEAAQRVGVPASTLRYWESVGLLDPPQRVGGKRRYGASALRQIEMIILAKRAGFTLAETAILLTGFSEKTSPPQIWQDLAHRKLPEIEQRLAEDQSMKNILEEGLACKCPSLDDCLRSISAGAL